MANKVRIRSRTLPDGEGSYGYHKVTISDGIAEVTPEVAKALLRSGDWAPEDDKEAIKRTKELNPSKADVKESAEAEKERMLQQADQLSYDPDANAPGGVHVNLSNRTEGEGAR